MNRLLFIYNPTAGKGQIANHLNIILTTFAAAGWQTTVCPTMRRGHATDLAQTLAPEFDRVICAGGDGTLSEVVSGLMKLNSPPILGYIPAGSTNDCATTLHIPREVQRAATIAAKTGVPRPWDIGRLQDKTFAYVAAFGAFTSVAYETSQELKNAFGHLAYILGGVASIPTITRYPLKLEFNDTVIEDEFYYGMICNTISVAGFKAVPTDHVELDDGLFEVILVRRPTKVTDISDSLQALIRNEPLEHGALLSFHTKKLSISSEESIPWTCDGEYGGSFKTCVIENQHRALTVLQGE